MSLIQNQSKVADINGVIASVIVGLSPDGSESSRVESGDDSWRVVLSLAIDLRVAAGESINQLHIGRHSVYVQREGDEIVALVVPVQHPQCKSMRRTIRRLAKLRKSSPKTPEVEGTVIAAMAADGTKHTLTITAEPQL